MSPKEAYKYSRALRTHLSQYNICTKQDVAPFPTQNFVWGGCQGFAGPDPSTFLDENA
jgi:hypothetical protein